jgi:hypothetical protein
MRAYMELFGVYTKQFQPLAEHLGAKAAVDLVLQVNSPLSDVTPAMWDSLAAQANGGQYTALLKKLDDSIPAAKRPGPAIPPKKSTKKSAKRSSRSSSSSDDHSSSDEDEDSTPRRSSNKHHKPSRGSADMAGVPKLLTRGFTLLAGAIKEAAGSRAHHQGDGRRGKEWPRSGNRDGGGAGGGSGGGGGGKGGKGGRGGK